MHEIEPVSLAQGISRPAPAGMAPCLWLRLSNCGQIKSLRTRQILFEAQEEVKSVTIVQRGLLLLFRGDTILDFAEPGQSVAGALINNRERSIRYPISAQAACPSEVLEIKVENFTRLLAECADLQHFIQTQFRLRMAFIQKCRTVQSLPVAGRVATVLLEKQQAMASGAVTRKIVAQISGTSTESVIRLISLWSSKNILRVQQRKIFLTDPSALEDLCRLQPKQNP